jgi:Methane oxygenase PmoA
MQFLKTTQILKPASCNIVTVLSFCALIAACWEFGGDRAFADDPKYRMVTSADRIDIFDGATLVSQYHTKSNAKPIVWPLIGPDGVALTRAWPMSEENADEKRDHPHHRSLWFTHGEVNDVDFWGELPNHGNIVHREFTELKENNAKVSIAAINDWIGPTAVKVLEEKRRISFHGNADLRMIDCDFRLTATDADVHFGDTKEGSFGVRVAEWMSVDAKQGGRLVNAADETDAKAWGKPSPWVDYQGPRDGKIYGLAILCHPKTFRSPGRWHARTYGLFAHNPFGVKHFLAEGEPAPEVAGGYTLPKGESIDFHYRVILHRGNEQDSQVAKMYDEYAVSQPESLGN